MAYRSYIIKSGGSESTVPVRINGLTKYITFKKNGWDDAPAQFDTADRALAQAIEAGALYRRGLITVTGDTVPFAEERPARAVTEEVQAQDVKEVGTVPGIPEAPEQAEEYADVTSVKDAKEILNKKFGVLYSRMPNAEETKSVAAEYGVSFPGLS